MMNLRPIQLIAVESNWRLFTIRKADSKFQKFQEHIFQRDAYTCQYCGFVSKHFMEVINADMDYHNNRIDNLITACHFCAQCFFLDGVGKSDYGGGILIYFPEITQTELNALCHVLFAMMMSGGQSSADAKTIYRNLRLRSQPVEKELGKGLNAPNVYGQLLIDSSVDNKDRLHEELMLKLRILPTMTRYVNQMEGWAWEALAGMACYD